MCDYPRYMEMFEEIPAKKLKFKSSTFLNSQILIYKDSLFKGMFSTSISYYFLQVIYFSKFVIIKKANDDL